MKTLAYIGVGGVGALMTSLFFDFYLTSHLDETRYWFNLLGAFIGCLLLKMTIKSKGSK
jgi:hypothetical protein